MIKAGTTMGRPIHFFRVAQGGVLEFGPLCIDRQTCTAGNLLLHDYTPGTPVDMWTCPHQILAVTLTLSKLGG